MIYNIVLVSGVQSTVSGLFCFCRVYSIIRYYKILGIIPGAMQ